MNKQKILIITHTQDNASVQKVIGFIEEAGATAIRFNTDCYPLSCRLSSAYVNNAWQIYFCDEQTTHTLHDVTAVWYRRSYNLGQGLKDVLEPAYVGPAVVEAKRTLFGMLEGLHCFHMERFSTYRRLDSKEDQLKTAARIGLRIPPTCISNDPQQVQQFIQQQGGKVIAKMQHSFAIYKTHDEQVVYTNEVTADHVGELQTLQYCPMVFQQRIDKKLELRVTVVGNTLFAFSIDSQKNLLAQVDWRKEGHTLVNDWQPCELPLPLQKQLLAFMRACRLNYGAIDLILTPNDEYYFLEVNAAGEFFWLDKLCDYAISKQISRVLLHEADRAIF